MDTRNESEKRDSVRAALCATVRFSVLNADTYEAHKKKEAPLKKTGRSCISPGVTYKEDERPLGKGVDPRLVDFLIQIEDKLDRVLDLLVEREQTQTAVFTGQGLDISGGGMSLFSEKEVLPNQVLDLHFRVFRYPAVTLNVFATVARTESMEMGGKDGWHVAVEFMDLDESEKEWIISYVFQVQRETIRNKKVQL